MKWLDWTFVALCPVWLAIVIGWCAVWGFADMAYHAYTALALG